MPLKARLVVYFGKHRLHNQGLLNGFVPRRATIGDDGSKMVFLIVRNIQDRQEILSIELGRS